MFRIQERILIRKFVSTMFVLMAGAVFADTVPVVALEAKIRGMMDENMTAGMSVVVVKGDKVVYQQAFGYRDKDTREPLDVNDSFRIASISKSFSADFLSTNRPRGASTVRAALKDLAGNDIVYKTDAGRIVYDRLFVEYLCSIQ